MAVVKEIKNIREPFTKGVAEFYINLGKNSADNEISTMLKSVKTDLLFDELARRYSSMSNILSAIYGESGDFTKDMDVVYRLQNHFKTLETLVAQVRKAAKV